MLCRASLSVGVGRSAAASGRSWPSLSLAQRSFAANSAEAAKTFEISTPIMHRCQWPSSEKTTKVSATKDELTKFYVDMWALRRLEIAADKLYKQKLIRGFLHLVNGQVGLLLWCV